MELPTPVDSEDEFCYNFSEMQVREFLKNQHPEQLLQQLGIRYQQHPEWPQLWQFNYDQILSYDHRTHPVVCECRGVILDQHNHWQPVARPLDRFFNWAEPGAADLHWPSVQVQEKLDGSLIIMYHWNHSWHVATRDRICANGNVGDQCFTFAQLFWRVWNQQMPADQLQLLRTDCTYMFELTSVWNRVVTAQHQSQISLLAVRETQSGQEHSVQHWPQLNPVKTFELSSADQVLAAADQLNPVEQEGYVLVDQYQRRVKVKSPAYVQLHRLRSSCNTREMLQLIQQQETSELFSYFDDLALRWQQLNTAYDALANQIDQLWQDAQLQQLKAAGAARRELAHRIMQLTDGASGALFARLDGRVMHARHWLSNLPVARVQALLRQHNLLSDYGTVSVLASTNHKHLEDS